MQPNVNNQWRQLVDALMKHTYPNSNLIKGLELMLAKAKLGQITDGLLMGCGHDGGGKDEWFHHYAIEREDDMVVFIAEMDLFKDMLKASIHNTRGRAASVSKVKSISGLD